jgi:hypothetical protein
VSARVLTEAASLTCAAGEPAAPHGGTLKVTGSARLRVDGKPVLTGASLRNGTLTLCGNNPNAGQAPCSGVQEIDPRATRLKVDGNPVALESFTSKTNGTPPGKLAPLSGLQERLRSD